MADRRKIVPPAIRDSSSLTLCDHVKTLAEDLTACIPYVTSPSTVVSNSREDTQKLRTAASNVSKNSKRWLPAFIVSSDLVKGLNRLINNYVLRTGSQLMAAQIPPAVFKKILKSFNDLISKIDTLTSIEIRSTINLHQCEGISGESQQIDEVKSVDQG